MRRIQTSEKLSSLLEQPVPCHAALVLERLQKHTSTANVWFTLGHEQEHFVYIEDRPLIEGLLHLEDKTTVKEEDVKRLAEAIRACRGFPVGIVNYAWEQLTEDQTVVCNSCFACVSAAEVTQHNSICYSFPGLPHGFDAAWEMKSFHTRTAALTYRKARRFEIPINRSVLFDVSSLDAGGQKGSIKVTRGLYTMCEDVTGQRDVTSQWKDYIGEVSFACMSDHILSQRTCVRPDRSVQPSAGWRTITLEICSQCDPFVSLYIPLAPGDAVWIRGSWRVKTNLEASKHVSPQATVWKRCACRDITRSSTVLVVEPETDSYTATVCFKGSETNTYTVQRNSDLEIATVPQHRCISWESNPQFPFTLLPYQAEFLQLVWEKRCVTAHHNMSAGKTVEFLSCMYRLRAQKPDATVLICAPLLSAHSPWGQALSNTQLPFADQYLMLQQRRKQVGTPGHGKSIIWVSYEYLAHVFKEAAAHTNIYETLFVNKYDLIILDESYELKNPKTQARMAVGKILENSPDGAMCVGGTGSSLDSPAAVTSLAVPKGGFLSEPKTWMGKNGSLKLEYIHTLGAHVHVVTQERVRSEQLEHAKHLSFASPREEYLTFDVYHRMDKNTKEQYQRLIAEARSYFGNRDRRGFCTLVKMWQLEFHPCFAASTWKTWKIGADKKRKRGVISVGPGAAQKEALLKIGADPSELITQSFQWLRDVKDTHARIILASPYSSMLHCMYNLLREDADINDHFGERLYVYTGKQKPSDRAAIEKDLQTLKDTDIPALLLLSHGTGGLAISFTSCTAMLIFQASWRASGEPQLVSRMVRSGQNAEDPLVAYIHPVHGLSRAVRQLREDKIQLTKRVRATCTRSAPKVESNSTSRKAEVQWK